MRMRLFLTLLCLTVPLAVCAATVQLPETGQSSCYDSAGNVILCTDPLGVGQDAAEKSGAAWPSPRFVDYGNGTVMDYLTGLIWLKDANCAATLGGITKTSTLTWANALTWTNALASGSCGLSDGSVAGSWRLPNVRELQSLLNASQANNAIWLVSQGFSNIQTNYSYCTATSCANTPASAWFVDMSNGYTYFNSKTMPLYVWPVRGGQ